jgi:Ca2+-transporting ATPase
MLGGGGQHTECPSDSPSHSHQVLSSDLLSPPSPVPSNLSHSGSWDPLLSSTLPNHSTRFPTTLQLRDNEPEEKSELSSLVGPKDGEKSPEIDNFVGDDFYTTHGTELAEDAAIDPTPFRFKPYELAGMLDPKNIGTLVGFGGIDGLLRGLGTNPDTGLMTNTQYLESSYNPDNLLVFSATIEDRRRVYGENVLPTRNEKTLLRLIWTALKDKVLVSNSFAVFALSGPA